MSLYNSKPRRRFYQERPVRCLSDSYLPVPALVDHHPENTAWQKNKLSPGFHRYFLKNRLRDGSKLRRALLAASISHLLIRVLCLPLLEHFRQVGEEGPDNLWEPALLPRWISSRLQISSFSNALPDTSCRAGRDPLQQDLVQHDHEIRFNSLILRRTLVCKLRCLTNCALLGQTAFWGGSEEEPGGSTIIAIGIRTLRAGKLHSARLGCIEADVSKWVFILQHFSVSTIFAHFCTASNSNVQQTFAKMLLVPLSEIPFSLFLPMLTQTHRFSDRCWQVSSEICEMMKFRIFRCQLQKKHRQSKRESKKVSRAAYSTAASVANNFELPSSVKRGSTYLGEVHQLRLEVFVSLEALVERSALGLVEEPLDVRFLAQFLWNAKRLSAAICTAQLNNSRNSLLHGYVLTVLNNYR